MEAEILIPTDINEISLGNYQKFMASYKDSNDDEFICQKMVEIFCGLRLRDVFKIRWADVEDITIQMTEVFKGKPKFEKTFTLNKIEFGFIPNIEDMSFGEYIDLEANIFKIENLHKAMAVLYRPITDKYKDKYNIEDYEGTVTYDEIMKYAPLGISLAAQVFFWTLKKDLLKSTLLYLKKQIKIKKKTSQKEHNLENNGDGINAYMQLVTENLNDLEVSPDYQYKTVLHGCLLKSKSEILNIGKCKEN